MNHSAEPKDKLTSIVEFLTSSVFLRPFLGVLIGGIGGFLYYYFIGCTSGSCAITSSPISSVLFGAAIGFFAVSSPCSRNKC
ncbi:DUF6132 family protein [Bacteroidota bacterium]